MSTEDDNVQINQQIPRENTSVLMKIIIGILSAIAIYVLITIIIGLSNRRSKYKMNTL